MGGNKFRCKIAPKKFKLQMDVKKFSVSNWCKNILGFQWV